MESWARRYRNNAEVQFLCVCVESKEVALFFSRSFRLENALNSFIPGRSFMPVGYGQLGCSGFIVSNANGYFITRKTTSYLDYGERAFADVEAILDKELDGPEAKPVRKDEKKEEDNLSEIETPPSVGVQSIDIEHKECTTALNALLQTPSLDNLAKAVDLLAKHFEHEEEIMKAHDFGIAAQGSSFSPLVSHSQDHQRILDIGRGALGNGGGCHGLSA